MRSGPNPIFRIHILLLADLGLSHWSEKGLNSTGAILVVPPFFFHPFPRLLRSGSSMVQCRTQLRQVSICSLSSCPHPLLGCVCSSVRDSHNQTMLVLPDLTTDQPPFLTRQSASSPTPIVPSRMSTKSPLSSLVPTT